MFKNTHSKFITVSRIIDVLSLVFILIFTTVFIVISFQHTYFFQIQSPAQFLEIKNDLSGKYKIRNQYLEFDYDYETIGNEKHFSGHLDGQNTTITMVHYLGNSKNEFALFDYNYGIIENVNFYVKPTTTFALTENFSLCSFICVNNYGIIRNCTIHLIGFELNFDKYKNCSFSSICFFNDGTIENCVVQGTMSVANGDDNNVGENLCIKTGENSQIQDSSSKITVKYGTS